MHESTDLHRVLGALHQVWAALSARQAGGGDQHRARASRAALGLLDGGGESMTAMLACTFPWAWSVASGHPSWSVLR